MSRATRRARPDANVAAPEPGAIAVVQRKLLAWFAADGSDLPWRGLRDPYAVLVSEFMLQQTQRARVVPKFHEFLERFPTIEAVARAPAAAVIRAWSGLGYNRRALALQAIARKAMQRGGALPAEREALQALPGVGAYTAGAVACFGFGEQVAFVDTNIRRVLGRVFRGEPFPPARPKQDEALANAVLPAGRAYDWNSALMDLGARICVARAPRCHACPLGGECLARPHFDAGVAREPPGAADTDDATSALRRVAEAKTDYAAGRRAGAKQTQPYAASDRFLRGRIVEALRRLPDGAALSLPELALAATGMALPPQDDRVRALLERLVREGLVACLDGCGERAPRFRLPD